MNPTDAIDMLGGLLFFTLVGWGVTSVVSTVGFVVIWWKSRSGPR